MGTEAEKTENPDLAPLTERELAIAAGLDPDLVTVETTERATEGKEAPQTASPSAKADPTPPETAEVAQPTASAQDASAAEGGTEAAPAEGGWITPQILSQARAYGLSDADVQGFEDQEAFDRAAVLFDRFLVSSAKPEEEKPAEKPPARVQPAAQETAPAAAAPANTPEGEFDPEYYVKEGYDAATVNMAKALKAQMERTAELQRQLESVAKGQQKAAEADKTEKGRFFHDVVNTMDADLFGRTVDENGKPRKLTTAEEACRQKLWYTASDLMSASIRAARARGEEPDTSDLAGYLARAKRIAFAEELAAKKQREFQEKVVAQSKRRRPASGAVKANPVRHGANTGVPETEVDMAKAIANDPRVIAAYEKFQMQ